MRIILLLLLLESELKNNVDLCVYLLVLATIGGETVGQSMCTSCCV